MKRRIESAANQNTFAIIFDMDGVIVNNMAYHRKAWEKFLKKYAPDIELEEFSYHFGKANKDLMRIVFKREISEEEESRYGEEKEALYRTLYAEAIVPTAGLIDFLNELKKNVVRMAVASSAPKVNVDFVLNKTGLRGYFDFLIDASEVQKGKPDPEIFLKAAAKLGHKPESCLVFEDSLPGIQAARNAGMKVIALTTSYPSQKLINAEFSVKDFTEISFETVRNCFKD